MTSIKNRMVCMSGDFQQKAGGKQKEEGIGTTKMHPFLFRSEFLSELKHVFLEVGLRGVESVFRIYRCACTVHVVSSLFFLFINLSIWVLEQYALHLLCHPALFAYSLWYVSSSSLKSIEIYCNYNTIQWLYNVIVLNFIKAVL